MPYRLRSLRDGLVSYSGSHHPLFMDFYYPHIFRSNEVDRHFSLAVAVPKAGGLGFLGLGTDISTFPSLLIEAATALHSSPIAKTPPHIIPSGVGFICWRADLSTALSIIQSAPLKPAAAWLFAPQDPKGLTTWTEGIRIESSGKTKIWIQVGTVAMALSVAKSCKPDVLVIQVSLVSYGIAVCCLRAQSFGGSPSLHEYLSLKLRSSAPQFPPAFQEISVLIE
jgi:hypothetical protein